MKLTINKASRLLHSSRETLARGLRANGVEVAAGKTFSLLQLHTALAGDLRWEKVRLTRAQAVEQELENKVRDGELHSLKFVEKRLWLDLLLPLRQALENLPEELAPKIKADPEHARETIEAQVEYIKKKILLNAEPK